MNPLAGVTFAWVAIYLFLGVWFVLLGTLRRVGEEYTLFGILALVGSAYGASAAFQNATWGTAASPWESFHAASGFAAVALCLDLATRFAQTRERLGRLVVGGYAYAVVMILVVAGRWVFVDANADRTFTLGALRLHYHEPTYTVAGLVAMIPAAALVLATTALLLRAARRGERWLWPVALTHAAVSLSFGWDGAVSARGLRAPYLLEHAGFVFVFTVSYTLISRMSERLSASTEELRRSREMLTRVRATLEAREPLAAVGELSAIVAHEVRNPLAAITNAAATLRKPDLPRADRDLLLQIQEEECTRLNRIVTDLLQLAKPINLQRRPVELRDLVDRSLGPAHREHTQVQVTVSPGGDAPLVCDAQLMRHALENVVDNAVQAMGRGGSLVVRLERATRGGVKGRQITIIDDGEGMNTEVRSRARNPFFTTRTTGTGLGLAIVDRILTAHRGAVDIESSKGMGTTVKLFVPEVEED